MLLLLLLFRLISCAGSVVGFTANTPNQYPVIPPSDTPYVTGFIPGSRVLPLGRCFLRSLISNRSVFSSDRVSNAFATECSNSSRHAMLAFKARCSLLMVEKHGLAFSVLDVRRLSKPRTRSRFQLSSRDGLPFEQVDMSICTSSI